MSHEKLLKIKIANDKRHDPTNSFPLQLHANNKDIDK